MASSIGYLAGSFLSGWFVVRLGTRRAILAGGIGLAAGTAGVILFAPFWLVIASFIVSGLANGCLEIAVNQVVPEMTEEPSSQARYFNALHGFYGIGSFIYPVVAAMLIAATGKWRVSYLLLLGLLCVLIASVWWWPSERHRRKRQRQRHREHQSAPTPAAVAMEPMQPEPAPQTAAAEANGAVRRKLPWFALGVLMFTLLTYTMAEVTMGTWLPTYLVHVRHYTVVTSSYALSGFYGLYTIGRLTAPLWVHRMGRGRGIGLSAAVAFAATTGALFSGSGPWVIILFCVSGIGFAAVFPTITAVASAMDEARSGRILGILFTVAGFAGLLVNVLVGAIATAYSLAIGFGIVSALLALVLIGIACFSILQLKTRYTHAHADELNLEGGSQ